MPTKASAIAEILGTYDAISPSAAVSCSLGLTMRRVTRAMAIVPAIEAGIVSGWANVVEVTIGCI